MHMVYMDNYHTTSIPTAVKYIPSSFIFSCCANGRITNSAVYTIVRAEVGLIGDESDTQSSMHYKTRKDL